MFALLGYNTVKLLDYNTNILLFFNVYQRCSSEQTERLSLLMTLLDCGRQLQVKDSSYPQK